MKRCSSVGFFLGECEDEAEERAGGAVALEPVAPFFLMPLQM